MEFELAEKLKRHRARKIISYFTLTAYLRYSDKYREKYSKDFILSLPMSHPKALFLLPHQNKLFKFHICIEAELPRKATKVTFLAVLLLFVMI